MRAGDLVTFVEKEMRNGAAPVMYRTVGVVQELHECLGTNGETLVFVKELQRFVWVHGYPELGRFVPTDRGGRVADLSEVSPLFVTEATP